MTVAEFYPGAEMPFMILHNHTIHIKYQDIIRFKDHCESSFAGEDSDYRQNE